MLSSLSSVPHDASVVLAAGAAPPETPATVATPAAWVTRAQAHFLFNALHAVGTLVRLERNDHAVRALAQLGELQRHLFERDDAPLVPLAAELEFVELYLGFERLRFGEELSVLIAPEPELETLRVPNLLLLTLVENAVKHGIARRQGRGRVAISVHRRDDHAEIVVQNDAPLADKSGVVGMGFGLRSVRERLRQHYGARAAFVFQTHTFTGVTATLRLPL